jgi:hypothetical protein
MRPSDIALSVPYARLSAGAGMMPNMTRSALTAVAGWSVAAVVAIGAGVVAISELGEGITGRSGQSLTPAQVRRALASPYRTPAPAPSTTPSPTGGPEGVSHGFSTTGGSVVARCTDAGAYLVSWSPDQGYSADGADRGPARAVELTFESGSTEITARITCDAHGPVLTTTRDDRRRGRGRGHGGGG